MALLAGSVGLPPNFTGCISCTSTGCPTSPCSLRVAAFALFAAVRAASYSAPSTILNGPCGRGTPAGYADQSEIEKLPERRSAAPPTAVLSVATSAATPPRSAAAVAPPPSNTQRHRRRTSRRRQGGRQRQLRARPAVSENVPFRSHSPPDSTKSASPPLAPIVCQTYSYVTKRPTEVAGTSGEA